MNNHKVKITHTLLVKPESERTEEENSAIRAYDECRNRRIETLKNENKRIVQDCKMLCSVMKTAPIPEYGWIRPISELCYELESMNILYRKYGLKVVLVQSKEKYATLRFYTAIDYSPVGLLGMLSKPVVAAIDKLHQVDYGTKWVMDRESFKTVEWKEITKENYDKGLNEYGNHLEPLKSVGKDLVYIKDKNEIHSLVEHESKIFLVEENGKYFYSYLLLHPAKTHVVFTKHRFLKKLQDILGRVDCFLSGLHKDTPTDNVLSIAFDNRVDELVAIAEQKCFCLCQHCGTIIGTDYEPRCVTQGYFTYLCEECAMASGVVYDKNGVKYLEGTETKNDEKPDAVNNNGDKNGKRQ